MLEFSRVPHPMCVLLCGKVTRYGASGVNVNDTLENATPQAS